MSKKLPEHTLVLGDIMSQVCDRITKIGEHEAPINEETEDAIDGDPSDSRYGVKSESSPSETTARGGVLRN